MHTILVTNKHISQLHACTRLLLRGFLSGENKSVEFSFCQWNPSASCVDSALPSLKRSIPTFGEWRAVVVIDPIEDEADQKLVESKCDNPFDFLVNRSDIPYKSQLVDNEAALVRLTHMLAGFPSLSTKGWSRHVHWSYFEADDPENSLISGEVNESHFDSREDFEEELLRLKEKHRNNLEIDYLEEKYDEQQRADHKDLTKKYLPQFRRPKEIILISARKKESRTGIEDLQKFWTNRLRDESSEFHARNNYPHICRFVCFDYEDEGARLSTAEKFKFAASVLSICTNQIPTSFLQAYRLYRVRVEISNECLEKALSSHLGNLFAASKYLAHQILLQPERSFEDDEKILTDELIPVEFRRYDAFKLFVRTKGLGLATDCPENELTRWKNDVQESTQHVDKLRKSIIRTVEAVSTFTREKVETYLSEDVTLDKFQKEDLREDINNLEHKIFLSKGRTVLKFQKHVSNLDDKDKRTQRHINTRMNRSMIVAYGIIIMGAFSIGLLPYVHNIMFRQFALSSMVALSFVILSLVIVSAGGIVALMEQRLQVRMKMEEYNGAIRNLLQTIHVGSVQFSKYLSDVATYMKARSMLLDANLKNSSRYVHIRALKTHERAVKRLIKAEQELAASFGITLKAEPGYFEVRTFYPERGLDDNRLYQLEKNTTDETLALNQAGKYLYAPYNFITGLIIEREEIYDDIVQEAKHG